MGGSGGKGKTTPTVSPYEEAAAGIANKTYAETTPVRNDLLSQMGNFLQGGYDVSKSPTFAPLYANARSGIESQYGVAKDAILAGTPRGGGQTAALAGVESDRAGNLSNTQNAIYSNLFNDILQKTYGVAFNAPQQSMAGLGQAGSSYASRYGAANQAYSAQQANWFNMVDNIGTGAGRAMGIAK